MRGLQEPLFASKFVFLCPLTSASVDYGKKIRNVVRVEVGTKTLALILVQI